MVDCVVFFKNKAEGVADKQASCLYSQFVLLGVFFSLKVFRTIIKSGVPIPAGRAKKKQKKKQSLLRTVFCFAGVFLVL